MGPEIWVPLVAVGVPGVLLSLHGLMRAERKRTKVQIDEQIEACVSEKLHPVLVELKGISSKLDNGVLEASKEHTNGIADLKVEVAQLTIQVNNLSGQVERLLVSR